MPVLFFSETTQFINPVESIGIFPAHSYRISPSMGNIYIEY